MARKLSYLFDVEQTNCPHRRDPALPGRWLQAAGTPWSWLTIIRPSVATDWKFSGVISDSGMVKSN